MSPLVDQLRAALDEKERLASRSDLPVTGWYAAADIDIDVRPRRSGGVPDFDAEFIADNSPAHVLRTVAAHREILDRHKRLEPVWPTAEVKVLCYWCIENAAWPCPDVRSIAAIYDLKEGDE